ncbi:hypothetical protein ACP4OV_004219 [Aristida adscensionis]
MVAAVGVEAPRRAKGSGATEEGRNKEAPSLPLALPARRRPTPDHPPYCWMIGEAIDTLAEDGGSPEGSISAFIRARHPGVPDAHDRFFQHYLAKHVAEGFFVRSARGLYARSIDGAAAVVDVPVEQPVVGVGSPRAALGGPPVTEVKRGRGRPRKDGSSTPLGVGKSKTGGGGAPEATPKRRGRPRRDAAPLAADEGSVPAAPAAAAADNGGGPAAPAPPQPRRRGRLRKLAQVTSAGGSGEAVDTGKKHGGDAPSTMDKQDERSHELALMVIPDADATTPMDHDQPIELALVSATDMSVPAAVTDKEDGGEALVAKHDDVAATSTVPERSSQPLQLALVGLAAGGKDGGVVPSATPKGRRQPRKEAPVDKKKPVTNKEDGGEAPSANLALVAVAKQDPVAATSTVPERRLRSSQSLELALVAADGYAPGLAAGEKDGGVVPSASPKGRRQPRKAAPVDNGGNALSATPQGRRRLRKPALVAAGNSSAPTPVAGKKAGTKVQFAMPKQALVLAGGGSSPASANGKGKGGKKPPSPAMKPQSRPREPCPLTADEIPDDPAFCLLALPAPMPPPANA